MTSILNKTSIKKIGVMTSGGDSPGMNAAVRAVVRACAYHGLESIGIEQGYKGLIENKFIPLGPRDVQHIIHRGGTFLKSARCLAFKEKEGRKQAYTHFKAQGLDAFVCIGGDGSFAGAKIFGEEFNVPIIGIPGTIDNDIFGTDYTIGYDTAMNTVVEAIDKIRDTATSHDRLFFVEVMGRDSGFIALNTGIASGAHEILVPEIEDRMEDVFYNIREGEAKGKTSSIIVVAEGEELGAIYDIAKATQKEFPSYDIRVTVLGHVQRGGAPSCLDRVLGSRLGVAAVEALMNGQSAVMVGVRGQKIIFTPFDQAIKQHSILDKSLLHVANVLART